MHYFFFVLNSEREVTKFVRCNQLQ